MRPTLLNFASVVSVVSVVSLLALCWGTCSSATAATRVGPLKFHVSPSVVDVGKVKKFSAGFKSFNVINNMPCGITVRTRTGGARSFGTVCYGLTNLGEIIPGRSCGCRVTFRPRREGGEQGQVQVTVGYGLTCRSLVREGVIEDYKPKIARAIERRDKHIKRGDGVPAFDERAKKAERARLERLATLEAEWRFLRHNQPDVEKHVTRRAQWRKTARERERKVKQRLTQMLTKGPDLSGLNAVLQEVERKGKEDVRKTEAEVNQTCALVNTLIAEKKTAVEEMRRGRYCSRCKRPATRIRREERESFMAHVRRVRGRVIPGTRRQIENEAREWDNKINNAVKRCNNARGRIQRAAERWKRRWDQVSARKDRLKARHADRVKRTQERLSQVRDQNKARDKALRDRIEAAEERHQQRYEQATKELEQQRRRLKEFRQEVLKKREKLRKEFQARKERLQKDIDELEALRDKRIRDEMIRLKSTRSTTVGISGVGI